MPTTIKLKNSVTTTNTPTSLVQGEVAINITDKKVWVGNAATTPIQIVGAGTTGNAAGSNTQVQYNSSGSFAGDADFTFNGTTVTMANDASISGLTVGKGGGAVSANTAVGYQAGFSNTTGNSLTAVGFSAAYSNTTGADNLAIGYNALYSNVTGNYNVAIGRGTLNGGTAVSNGVAVGYQALNSNSASNNTAVGYQAGYSNTTGGGLTFVGAGTGYSNTTGTDNVAVGSGNTAGYAFTTNTTGSFNSVLGSAALKLNTTGSNNTAIGFGAMLSNTTASGQTALGFQAGYSNTVAGNNTYLGTQAGYSNVTSTDNTYVGQQAGYACTGAGNVMVGSASSAAAAANNFTIVIGYNTVGKGSSTGFINANGGAMYNGGNTTTWTTTSDRRIKKNIVDNNDGLNKISGIRVRNFEYRLPEEVDAELKPTDAIKKSGIQLGVIAQEIQEVLPNCVRAESTGVLSVQTDDLIWYAINAIKELKAEVDSLKAQLNNGA